MQPSVMWQAAKCHVTGSQVPCDKQLRIIWQVAKYHVTDSQVSCDMQPSVMWQAAKYLVTDSQMSYDRQPSVMWQPSIMWQAAKCHVTCSLVSCDSRWSIMWQADRCHMIDNHVRSQQTQMSLQQVLDVRIMLASWCLTMMFFQSHGYLTSVCQPVYNIFTTSYKLVGIML